MKKVKKMQANHLYMIRGASTANSPFFESERDCRLFLEMVDRFLGDYLEVACFQNNRDGWAMIITTRSAVAIKKAYYRRRARSMKCRKEHEYTEVWKMLSDQIRIFLSTYVKATNFRSGRTGGKVRCRFERFIFESEDEAMKMRHALEEQYYWQAQQRKRYRPSKRAHSMRRKYVRRSIYMSCYLLRIPAMVKKLGLMCLDLGVFVGDVVRQLVKRTLTHHITSPRGPNHST